MVDTQAALSSLENLKISDREVKHELTSRLLKITRQLGDGAQAKVYEAHTEQDSQTESFAVKVFSDFRRVGTEASAEREFEIMRKLEGNENVLQAAEFVKGKGRLQIPRNIQRDEYDVMAKYRTGVDTQDSATYMTMELCKQDLFDLIATKGQITNEPLAKYLFKQVCNGVEALHN